MKKNIYFLFIALNFLVFNKSSFSQSVKLRYNPCVFIYQDTLTIEQIVEILNETDSVVYLNYFSQNKIIDIGLDTIKIQYKNIYNLPENFSLGDTLFYNLNFFFPGKAGFDGKIATSYLEIPPKNKKNVVYLQKFKIKNINTFVVLARIDIFKNKAFTDDIEKGNIKEYISKNETYFLLGQFIFSDSKVYNIKNCTLDNYINKTLYNYNW